MAKEVVGVAYIGVSTIVSHVQSRLALLSTRVASTSTIVIFRGHSLMLVANVDEPEVDVTVLTIKTVGVLPGEIGSVVVPGTVPATVVLMLGTVEVGLLLDVAPSMPQYPLYSETPADKSIVCAPQFALIQEVKREEAKLCKSARQKQESRSLHPRMYMRALQQSVPEKQFRTQGRSEENAGCA